MAIQFKPRLTEGDDNNGWEEKRENLVPTTRRADVIRALVQRVDKEGMRMVPSLAKEMAKEGWQAELDIFRWAQANHVGMENLKGVIEAMACNTAYLRQVVANYPELEADAVEATAALHDVMKHEPQAGFVVYSGRYFHAGAGREDP